MVHIILPVPPLHKPCIVNKYTRSLYHYYIRSRSIPLCVFVPLSPSPLCAYTYNIHILLYHSGVNTIHILYVLHPRCIVKTRAKCKTSPNAFIHTYICSSSTTNNNKNISSISSSYSNNQNTNSCSHVYAYEQHIQTHTT